MYMCSWNKIITTHGVMQLVITAFHCILAGNVCYIKMPTFISLEGYMYRKWDLCVHMGPLCVHAHGTFACTEANHSLSTCGLPVRWKLWSVQFDHRDNVSLIIIRYLLHPSVLGHPHPSLGAGQAHGSGSGGGEGVCDLCEGRPKVGEKCWVG